MRVLLAFYFGLFSFVAAAEATLPAGCRAVAVQGESVTLKSKSGTLALIHNLGSTDLWITHPVNNPSASAGWSSHLSADHWSALAVSKRSFVLTCVESMPGHEQQIPCEGAIAVCQWNGVKIPGKEQSTFWVGEDQSLSALTATIGTRGFKVPVS